MQCRFERRRHGATKGPECVERTLLSAAFGLRFYVFPSLPRRRHRAATRCGWRCSCLAPYALLFCYSFWTVSPSQTIVHSWTLDNYRELLPGDVYWQTLFRSMWIAARVTVFSLLLGYPLAYFLSFYAESGKDLLYQLVIIPLWVSYLVRAYAWKTILGQRRRAQYAAAICAPHRHPLDFLLYSPFAVVLTLTHIYTPFTFLPIYASLEHIPRNLVEASNDLGASPFQTFWRVIFPLSIPGVLAGATFAFVLSLGDFLAPLLLGGPSGIMISNIVVSLFGAAYNWPLGAAISFCMLALVLALLFLLGKSGKAMELPMKSAVPLRDGSPGTRHCGLRVSLSAHRYAHYLFVQRGGRRRISAHANLTLELVSPSFLPTMRSGVGR